MIAILVIFCYLALLFFISRMTARRPSNDAFFRGERRSPWYMVAWGMIGASISGVTFVSVPGMVLWQDMTYMQTCLGFILGYLAVAFVLLPVYYRLNLTTIYAFLGQRLGRDAYKTGAAFFLLSKMTGAAARFYVVCLIVQQMLGTPFAPTVVAMVVLIWLYTRRGGIKTLVWTDGLQTACMFGALALIIYKVMGALDLSVGEAVRAIAADSHSRMFVFDDWVSRQNFWKQFLSGVFIVIVMTGLDQDMMQKNLTCKNLRDAQKDMCSYGLAFVPANLLFLSLGVLLTMLAAKQGVPLPTSGDELLPMFAATGVLGQGVLILFLLGMVAASFSSADSALTALTTSYCVDIRERPDDEALRRRVHIGMAVVFTMVILLFGLVNSTSVIDAIYVMCGYTYGPLLGLFAFALLRPKNNAQQSTVNCQLSTVNSRLVPIIAIASPIICLMIDNATRHFFDYRFGYELLMLNGFLTFVGLWILSKNQSISSSAS